MSDARSGYRALVEALRRLRDAAAIDDPQERKRAVDAFLAAAYELAKYVERT